MHSWVHLRFCGILLLGLGAPIDAQQPAASAPRAAAPATARRSAGIIGAYPERPPAPPAEIALGQHLFASNCSFCHGPDARGGETGPNLIRAQIVLDDQHGELITPIVQSGIPAAGMPSFKLTAADIAAVAAWLHSQPLSNRGEPSDLDILVGNARAGASYFAGAGHCTECHSISGDLAGIGRRYDPKMIQNLIVSGGAVRSHGPGGPAQLTKVPPPTVTVTLPSGETVKGELDHLTAFVVALREPDGTYRSFARHGDTPGVAVANPLQWHIAMLPKWEDTEVHDLAAYLVTLK